MSSTLKRILFGVAALIALVPTMAAKGAVMIDVGNIVLNANSKNQWTPILVTGGDSIYSLDFFVQVGSGMSGPRMVYDDGTQMVPGIDLESGIFNANNTGQSEIDVTLPSGASEDYVLGFSINRSDVLSDPEVFASGILAKICFDTTGLFSGTWDLRLTDVAATAPGTGRDTSMVDFNLGDVVPDIRNGTLTIIPEPSSLLLALSGVGLAAAVFAARRRAGRTHS